MAAAKKTPKPKRRKAVRKDDSIHIRMTTEQKETLTAAAARVGLGLSGWLLMLGLREAQKADGGSGTK